MDVRQLQCLVDESSECGSAGEVCYLQLPCFLDVVCLIVANRLGLVSVALWINNVNSTQAEAAKKATNKQHMEHCKLTGPRSERGVQ